MEKYVFVRHATRVICLNTNDSKFVRKMVEIVEYNPVMFIKIVGFIYISSFFLKFREVVPIAKIENRFGSNW